MLRNAAAYLWCQCGLDSHFKENLGYRDPLTFTKLSQRWPAVYFLQLSVADCKWASHEMNIVPFCPLFRRICSAHSSRRPSRAWLVLLVMWRKGWWPFGYQIFLSSLSPIPGIQFQENGVSSVLLARECGASASVDGTTEVWESKAENVHYGWLLG